MRKIVLAVAVALAVAAPAAADPDRWAADWPRTDFSRTEVPLPEIRAGGPPKDGIPALDAPRMITVAEETRLAPAEPVLVLEMPGDVPRAWPIRYLTWHEIVNDTAGGVPVAVTFCPLCNAAMVFDRRVGHRVLDFGVSGLLRHSDMIMYDRQTESWWQQATASAIVGEMAGTRLSQLPGWMESWASFSARNPGGLVMDEPDWPRSYGRNPYVRYDTADRPFLYEGRDPPHGIHPLERVVRVGDLAWPLSRVAAAGRVEEAGVTITWTSGEASALDAAEIGQGRDVGSVRVRGPAGEDVVHDVIFAFAFDAFHPEGRWMVGP